MSATPTSALRRLRAEHGPKALRYCGASVVNVTVSVGVLSFCHAALGWAAVWANLAAWMVSTVPAYLLSRAWVWRRGGSHRLGGEVAVFWLMALAGLGLSSLIVRAVEQITQETAFVVLGSFCSYGVMWVAKYLYLDRVMWPSTPSRR